MIEWLFWITFSLILYLLCGYPVILIALSFFGRQSVQRGNIAPEVTVIIPVFNEEKKIKEKLDNCLAWDYPPDKLRVIVASDCSTDRTEEIVRGYDSSRIRFLQLPFRGGKVSAQNYALRFCQSDIVIFTDVAILTEPDSVRLIVQNFHDPKIGAVSCRDMIAPNAGGSDGEGSYIKYDMMVRDYTSQIGSIIGVTGGFYAIRLEIAEGGWNPAYPPDFYAAIRCIKKGFRVVEDSRVKAMYKTAAKEWDELQRKVRTLNRGMRALLSKPNRALLDPFQFGWISFKFLSHKLLRWLSPFLFALLFAANGILAGVSWFYFSCFIGQLIFYVYVMMAHFRRFEQQKTRLHKLAIYFSIANLALLKAWYEFLVGKKYVSWTPTQR